MSRWFETFFDGLYQEVLPSQFDPKQSREQARLIKRLLKLRKGMHVLDIPCGAGRLTVPLANMGLQMTGLDLTGPFIARARRYARKRGTRVRFIQEDMRRIDFEEEFDAVVNWFTSFGYFSDVENLAFAKRILRALKPGGQFLIEASYKRWSARFGRGRTEQTIGGVTIRHDHLWDGPAGRARDVWTFIKGGRIERRRLNLRVYNGGELRKLLHNAGFRDIRMFGQPALSPVEGPPLGPLTRGAKRLIAIARKP